MRKVWYTIEENRPSDNWDIYDQIAVTFVTKHGARYHGLFIPPHSEMSCINKSEWTDEDDDRVYFTEDILKWKYGPNFSWQKFSEEQEDDDDWCFDDDDWDYEGDWALEITHEEEESAREYEEELLIEN